MKNNMEKPSIKTAMMNDALKNTEKDLLYYYKECCDFGPEKSVENVKIYKGILEYTVVIELKNNKTGQTTYKKTPLKKTIDELEDKNQEGTEFYIETKSIIVDYWIRIFESEKVINASSLSKEEKELQIEQLSQLVEMLNDILAKFKEIPKSFRTIISDKKRKEIENALESFENYEKEKGYNILQRHFNYTIKSVTDLIKTPSNKLTVLDHQYMIVAKTYLDEWKRKNMKKMETDTYITLPIEERLKLAYYNNASGRLSTAMREEASKKQPLGENVRKYFIEQDEAKRRNRVAIGKKIDAGENIDWQERVTYLDSLEEYELKDINWNILEEAPDIIRQLTLLKEQDNDNLAIKRNLCLYSDYLMLAQAMKNTKNSQERYEYIKEYLNTILEFQKERVKDFLEQKEDEIEKEDQYETKRKVLSFFTEYLLVTSDEEKWPIQSWQDYLDTSMEGLDKLAEGFSITTSLESYMNKGSKQEIYYIESIIKNFIAAHNFQESLSPNYIEYMNYYLDGYPLKNVIDYMNNQCQVIEAWDSVTMQEIKQDKLDIPKEKLLQKGLTV